MARGDGHRQESTLERRVLTPAAPCHLRTARGKPPGASVVPSSSPAAFDADGPRRRGANKSTQRVRLIENRLRFTPCLSGTAFVRLSIAWALWGGLGGGQLLRLPSPHPVASSLRAADLIHLLNLLQMSPHRQKPLDNNRAFQQASCFYLDATHILVHSNAR